MVEIPSFEGHTNGGGGALLVTSSETVGSKRQRRPSVRLGDIGVQPFESQIRRSSKLWKQLGVKDFNPNASIKGLKVRTTVDLSSGGGGGGGGGGGEFDNGTQDNSEERVDNLDGVAIGSWKIKDCKKRGYIATKRIRSNWSSKIDEGGGEREIYTGDFDMENLESTLKEHSPVNSMEDFGINGHGSEREMVSGPSDTDVRDWRDGEKNESGGRGRCGEDVVRIWLGNLGLGRYAPVFEVHEVDDEVLPMLTLEDLKDMGINAVGSRRKMFCAIQKLGKGFS